MAKNLPPPFENDFVGDNFTEPATPPPPPTSNMQMQPQPIIPDALDVKHGPMNMQEPTMSVQEETNEFPKIITLTIPAGMNIVTAIKSYGRTHDVDILVHYASGFVSKVNLFRQGFPSNNLSFEGNLFMMSLSGFYTNNQHSPFPPLESIVSHSPLTIQFAKEMDHLQLVGGSVRDELIAAKPVQVLVTVTKSHGNNNTGASDQKWFLY